MKRFKKSTGGLGLILVMFVFCLKTVSCFSQLTVNFYLNNQALFRADDIWKFSIINSSSADATCQLKINLYDEEGINILECNAYSVKIKQGLNSSFMYLRDQSELRYSNVEAAENLKQFGHLLAGKYKLCLNILPDDNSIHYAEKCTSIDVLERFVLKLVNPPDNSEVFTRQPVLHWMGIPSTPGTRYAIRLTFINEGQSENEALETNPLYVNEHDLSANSIVYPFSSPALIVNQNYIWQVTATRKNTTIATTEAWLFHLTNLDTIISPAVDCYRLIEKTANNEFYINDGFLRFGYSNRSNDKTLNFKIIDQQKNKVCPTELQVPLIFGLNKIDINIKKYFKLKNNRRYLLTINDSDNNNYQLVFSIVPR